MKCIVIVPTLNESKNVTKIFYKINNLNLNLDVLYVDDNSQDSTRLEILNLKKKFSNIKFIFRNKKLGIGSAHRDGINFAYKKNYNIAFTIDADGTHEPKIIKKMLRFILKGSEIVILTRFFNGKILLKNWSWYRKAFTFLRYFLVKIVLNTNLDSTGGFRCFNLKKIKKSHLNKANDNDYFYLIESLFYLEKLNYKFKEIPSYLDIRKNGSSKLSFKKILISFFKLFTLKMNNL